MATRNAQPHLTVALLHELAALYGIQPAYRNSRGRRMESPVESIVAVLRSLGCELPAQDGAALSKLGLTRAIQARKLQTWKRLVEPVIVAWDGVLPELVVRLPARAPRNVDLTLVLEDGSVREWGTVSRLPRAPTAAAHDMATSGLQWLAAETIGRERFVAYKTALSQGLRRAGRPVLPIGYHRLIVSAGEKSTEATVISAPRRCWPGQREREVSGDGPVPRTLADSGKRPGSQGHLAAEGTRSWGLFAPLYALRSERNWGAGDLADLQILAQNTAAAGGSVVATLPLLAAFLDTPYEPSPYRPVSRLFWNEFYLAPERIPGWQACSAAWEKWGSAELRKHLEVLRASELVDYRGVMAVKRTVLEQLTSCFFDGGNTMPQDAFASYLGNHPHAWEYAGFRARVEREGSDWRDWPEAHRADAPAAPSTARKAPEQRTVPTAPAIAGEAGPWPMSPAERYHLFCQWQMEEQLSGCSAGDSARRGTAAAYLFLDLPVSVHPGGFDTWRWRGQFVSDMSTGAPPDSFFSHGQNWESPPLHPGAIRIDGHRYFAASLRHQMHHSSYLRIDHVMSLHRLFWVPLGLSAADGVYVGYPAEELYAVLSLESNRNQTVIVGEDLGTVPPEVRPAMRRHGVLRTWVAQMSFRPSAVDPVGGPTPGSVASLNTHDMFPFAGFVRGDDIRAREATHQLDEAGARREAAARARLVERLSEWAMEQPPGMEDFPSALERLLAAQQSTSTLPEAQKRSTLCTLLVHLLRSSAALTLVNLEDLMLETGPQNVPGTGTAQGNWQRKVARGLGPDSILPGNRNWQLQLEQMKG